MRLFAAANSLKMGRMKFIGLLCLSAAAVALISIVAVEGCGGGVAAFTIFSLIRSSAATSEERERAAAGKLLERYVTEICITLDEISHIYNRTLVALFRQNARVLRDVSRRSSKLCREAEARRRSGAVLPRGAAGSLGVWLFGTRGALYTAEMCEALERIVRPACEHVERGGGLFSKEQTVALMRMNDAVDAMTHEVSAALSAESASAGLAGVRRQRDAVLDYVRECTCDQIARGGVGDGDDARTDLLFLTLLGETKTLALRMSGLLKVKRYGEQSGDVWK